MMGAGDPSCDLGAWVAPGCFLEELPLELGLQGWPRSSWLLEGKEEGFWVLQLQGPAQRPMKAGDCGGEPFISVHHLALPKPSTW